MPLRLTDTQIDAWVAENGLLPPGYGAFAKLLDQCERQHLDAEQRLRKALNEPTAPKLYFVPGVGLSDCPF